MRKVIHHLRKQPHEVRRGILHILMIVSAIILFTFWVKSFGNEVGSISTKDFEGSIKEELKPFSVLKDNVLDGYKNITEFGVAAN
jgi:hypothetical protein